MNKSLANKNVVLLTPGPSAAGVCSALLQAGARVTAVVEPGSAPSEELASQGVAVFRELPAGSLHLAVLCSDSASTRSWLSSLAARNVSVVSELEMGFDSAKCLTIAITGTNGKSSCGGLIEAILKASHRNTIRCGHLGPSLCGASAQSKNADFLVIEAPFGQLEHTVHFRPAVAVLTGVPAEPSGRFLSAADCAVAASRVFSRQEAHDWSIIQSGALTRLRELNIIPPGKVITFSATDSGADLWLDRGLVISRLANWSGPLVDMQHCAGRGPHHAENVMASLAVGHVLRLPLESMRDSARNYLPGPHRLTKVAEVNGVQFFDDARAVNLDATMKALLAFGGTAPAQANIWLISGGREQRCQFHDAGPLLSQRVKGAYLLGPAAEKMRAAWSLFTPCTVSQSLLEAVLETARNAVSGDVVLLSPACSSFDPFKDPEQLGEAFYSALKSIDWGAKP